MQRLFLLGAPSWVDNSSPAGRIIITMVRNFLSALSVAELDKGLSRLGLFSGPRTATDVRSTDEQEQVRQLVKRAQLGDKEAFGEIFNRYKQSISRLARSYVGPATEDAVAETFMRAWKDLHRYRPTAGSPFVAWLYGIARHVAADELRKRSRSTPVDQVPDNGFLEDHDSRLAIEAAIKRLPKKQREIIEMKYFLRLTNQEVADHLAKSIGAVNAQQWRALKTLKEVLG